MRLRSVNLSLPREVVFRGEKVLTGIFKAPVPGRVAVRRDHLEGDGQADLSVHGGADKAVYAYPVEHYSHWRQALGRAEFQPGQFGENLTVEGMIEDQVHVGDVFRVGSALLQITQPRTPCFKLGIRMEMPEFPKQFMKSERSGFYLRVMEEGELEAGDAITLIRAHPAALSVREVHHLRHFDRDNLEGARRVLGVDALAESWRRDFEKRLEKLEGASS